MQKLSLRLFRTTYWFCSTKTEEIGPWNVFAAGSFWYYSFSRMDIMNISASSFACGREEPMLVFFRSRSSFFFMYLPVCFFFKCISLKNSFHTPVFFLRVFLWNCIFQCCNNENNFVKAPLIFKALLVLIDM